MNIPSSKLSATNEKFVLYFLGIIYLLYFSFGLLFNFIDRNNFVGVLWLNLATILFIISIIIIIYVLKINVEDLSVYIILIGFIIGLLLAFSPISLSDDIYRYFFNSFLIQNEIDPNLVAPSAPSLSNIAQEFQWFNKIFQPDVKNPYPIIMVFSTYLINQIVGLDLNAWRIVMTAFVLIASLFLRKILEFSNQNKNYIILWAWNPLVLFEFSHSGHNDIMVLLLVIIIVYILKSKDKDKRTSQIILGMLWAIAISLKFFPLFILPFFLHKFRKIGFFFLFISISVFLVPSIFFSSVSNSGLLMFLKSFRFNGGIFELIPLFIEFMTKIINSTFGIQLLIDKTSFQIILRPIVLLVFILSWIFLIVLFYAKKFYLKSNYSYKFSIASLLLFILLSPIVHPWYLLWGLPLFLVHRSIFSYFIIGLIINISYFFFVCLCEYPILLLMEYFVVYTSILINILVIMKKLNAKCINERD